MKIVELNLRPGSASLTTEEPFPVSRVDSGPSGNSGKGRPSNDRWLSIATTEPQSEAECSETKGACTYVV